MGRPALTLLLIRASVRPKYAQAVEPAAMVKLGSTAALLAQCRDTAIAGFCSVIQGHEIRSMASKSSKHINFTSQNPGWAWQPPRS